MLPAFQRYEAFHQYVVILSDHSLHKCQKCISSLDLQPAIFWFPPMSGIHANLRLRNQHPSTCYKCCNYNNHFHPHRTAESGEHLPVSHRSRSLYLENQPALKTKDVARFFGTSRETTIDLLVRRSIAETFRECNVDIVFLQI